MVLAVDTGAGAIGTRGRVSPGLSVSPTGLPPNAAPELSGVGRPGLGRGEGLPSGFRFGLGLGVANVEGCFFAGPDTTGTWGA